MKPQQPHIQHSVQFSNRRRALFPSDGNCETDSDLGCISPLKFDSDHDNDYLINERVFSLNRCVGDYDIIGLVDKGTTVNTPKNNQPLGCITNKSNTFTPVTTVEESPTQQLKTPHDTSTNTTLPKLIRKTAHDPPILTSSENNKNSKVRTALFPEIDMSLPAKTFYSNKSDEENSPRSLVHIHKSTPKKSTNRRTNLYLCNRRSRFRSGQINAGVRHKIKKPKKVKRFNKHKILEAAINIIENSPLNEVLNYSLSEPSPSPSPEPDPSKKFFKTSRHKGVVTVTDQIKVEIDNGKIKIMENKTGVKRSHKSNSSNNNNKRLKLSYEFDEEDSDSLINNSQIKSIIDHLNDSKENTENEGLIMSPTSQMCNMTSGLALNSPKKARNLNGVLEALSEPKQQQNKLFPIFYPGVKQTPIPRPKTESPKAAVKKFKPIAKDQMLLDAGQKRWGITQCPECKIIYHMGDPGDEIMHLNYHNAEHIFRFNGWKNERLVCNLSDAKIIQILPNDSKIWLKKVKDILEVVNRDLGYFDYELNTAHCQVFFYIKNRVIVGVLVTEVKSTAYKLLTTSQEQVDLCSEESYPIKCGVCRIWVSQLHRKKGIATALMNCLKRNFMFGNILRNEDIAFSSPTEMGKIFGASYFKTPNFLIYFA